jgi:hypothetical protein
MFSLVSRREISWSDDLGGAYDLIALQRVGAERNIGPNCLCSNKQ